MLLRLRGFTQRAASQDLIHRLPAGILRRLKILVLIGLELREDSGSGHRLRGEKEGISMLLQLKLKGRDNLQQNRNSSVAKNAQAAAEKRGSRSDLEVQKVREEDTAVAKLPVLHGTFGGHPDR